MQITVKDYPKAHIFMFLQSELKNSEKEGTAAGIIGFLQSKNLDFTDTLPGQECIDFLSNFNPIFWDRGFRGLAQDGYLKVEESGITLTEKLLDFYKPYKGMKIIETEEKVEENITFWKKIKKLF